MAKFKVRSDEQVHGEFDVALLLGGKREPARLIMTSERLVVTTGGISGITQQAAFLAGLMGNVLDMLLGRGTSRIVYEIPRERFACVEADGNVTVFRSDGDGYAQTSFAIVRDLMSNTDTAETWQQRVTSVWPTLAG